MKEKWIRIALQVLKYAITIVCSYIAGESEVLTNLS